MLLELILRNAEALDDFGSRDRCVLVVAAGREQEGEEGLQDGEPLRRDRPGESLGSHDFNAERGRKLGHGRLSRVRLLDGAQCFGTQLTQFGRSGRHCATILAEHPGAEVAETRYGCHELLALDAAAVAIEAIDPPGGGWCHAYACLSGDLAALPRRDAAIQLDVEVGRDPEIAFPPRGEADLAGDPRDAERADVLAVEILPDDVPAAVVRKQRVRVHGALRQLVRRDRPVGEADGALFRDRRLELAEPPGELR